MPVDDDVRQQLLEVATVDERLRRECRLLQALGTLCCRACGATLARSTDAVQVGGWWCGLRHYPQHRYRLPGDGYCLQHVAHVAPHGQQRTYTPITPLSIPYH